MNRGMTILNYHPTKITIAHKETTSDPQNSIPKSLNWFEGNVTGKPYISWKKLWFPVDVPANPLTRNSRVLAPNTSYKWDYNDLYNP